MRRTTVAALAPLPPQVWARRPAALPFPFTAPGVVLFARARHALWHGIRAVGVQPGDEVLVPAFHHGSEVEAFNRAGVRCRFFDATDTLEPDEAELDALVGPRTRALHLIHYFGFPQDAARWRRWCDERGLALVEDAAQAWLATRDGQPAGSHGDVSVFCLYKSFGLPDGAVLLCRLPVEHPWRGRTAVVELALEHGLWLATRSRPLAWLADRRSPRRYVPAEEMALGDPLRRPSRVTLPALRRAFDPLAPTLRRGNYARLLALLPDLVTSAFAELSDGTSPFVFPIEVDEKEELIARLRERRVRTLNVWSAPHPSLAAAQFPRAAALRRRLVGLPVHQELRAGDHERVAEEVRHAVAGAYARGNGARVRGAGLEPRRPRGDAAERAGAPPR
jgi:hypothetical protein